MAYSRPYIMDLDEMQKKLGDDGIIEMLPAPKLKEIIREFVRLQGHCDEAIALCSDNVEKIIEHWPTNDENKKPKPYPPFT